MEGGLNPMNHPSPRVPAPDGLIRVLDRRPRDPNNEMNAFQHVSGIKIL